MTSIPRTTTVTVSLYGMNGYRWNNCTKCQEFNVLIILLQAHGPLTADNVFDYFATSMFYDKQSNNQVLRMQTMHTGVPVKDEAAELR